MGVMVRAARDDDDLDAMNLGNPCWMGAAMVRELFDATGEPSGILIAEGDGEPIGYGDYAAIGVMDGHRAPASIYIPPPHRGRGAGNALWGVIVEACRPDRVSGVLTQADGDDAASLDFALARGFQLGGLHIESELALDATDIAAKADRSPPPTGLSLGVLPSDADESTWHDFAALFERLERDTPDLAEGSDPTPYAVLRTFLPDPWQVMAAWDEGEREMVGFTAVAVRDAGTRTLNTLLTGIRPEYRGRGLATALKAAHAVALAGAGWRAIRTQNMEGNLPILASNKTLGFRPVRALQDLVYDHPSSAQGTAGD
jgi:mycothiol synthase